MSDRGPQTSAGAQKSKEPLFAHAELHQRAVAPYSYLIAWVVSSFSAFSAMGLSGCVYGLKLAELAPSYVKTGCKHLLI